MRCVQEFIIDVVIKIAWAVAWPVGLIAKAVKIGFRDGWSKVSDKPEPTDKEIQREIL